MSIKIVNIDQNRTNKLRRSDENKDRIIPPKVGYEYGIETINDRQQLE
ncbi:10874_t:CDS:2, partial [Racocetra persica]